MKKEHLVKFINEGKKFGIQLSPADSNYMGWIAVAKYSINQRVFDVLANDPDSPVFKKEKLKMEKPFWARVIELRRDVYESNSDPLDEHYRRNDFYTFYNIYEVEEFLQTLGYEITDLKWLADIEHN
jgi:hypothetical protein